MTGFVVDTMLGTLAKWLRAFGYDTSYMPHAKDDDLLAIAAEESRVLLTRDRELASRAGNTGMLVPGKSLDEQLRMVVGSFPERGSKPLSRCLSCNALLEIAQKDSNVMGGKVPAGVLARESEFWFCPSCGKYFWPGSHYVAMMRKVQSFFPDEV